WPKVRQDSFWEPPSARSAGSPSAPSPPPPRPARRATPPSVGWVRPCASLAAGPRAWRTASVPSWSPATPASGAGRDTWSTRSKSSGSRSRASNRRWT
ncbi:MAG: hypothetical protein AVDCRST_MAG22-1375, partial [uncultured Rubrobacteraceae bacterium]